MTFHALANSIVHPREDLVFDGSEGAVHGLSGTFQELINGHLQKTDYRDRMRTLMFDHFKNDWERIVRGKYDKSQEEFLEYIRSLRSESFGGDYVKSFGEKVIANYLFEHDINYKYELNHWWNQINYRPDFTLFFDTPKPSGVIIEYFGLDGDVDYDEMSAQKENTGQKNRVIGIMMMNPLCQKRTFIIGDLVRKAGTSTSKETSVLRDVSTN